jgi:ATP-dependent DNA helicase RecG
VQYVRYDGVDQAARVLHDRRFASDLLSVLRGLDQLAEDLAGSRPASGEGLAEKVVHDYPPRALHELFMNAVIHRNYEGSTTPVYVNHFADRIEISNPGGLYGDLTPEQFPRGTAYRNPVLAEAARTLGFVNRYGRGIAIAQDEMARNGSPPIKFVLGGNYFLAVVQRRDA